MWMTFGSDMNHKFVPVIPRDIASDTVITELWSEERFKLWQKQNPQYRLPSNDSLHVWGIVWAWKWDNIWRRYVVKRFKYSLLQKLSLTKSFIYGVFLPSRPTLPRL